MLFVCLFACPHTNTHTQAHTHTDTNTQTYTHMYLWDKSTCLEGSVDCVKSLWAELGSLASLDVQQHGLHIVEDAGREAPNLALGATEPHIHFAQPFHLGKCQTRAFQPISVWFGVAIGSVCQPQFNLGERRVRRRAMEDASQQKQATALVHRIMQESTRCQRNG